MKRIISFTLATLIALGSYSQLRARDEDDIFPIEDKLPEGCEIIYKPDHVGNFVHLDFFGGRSDANSFLTIEEDSLRLTFYLDAKVYFPNGKYIETKTDSFVVAPKNLSNSADTGLITTEVGRV